jgi:glucose/arabinose dehydrogenase
MNLAKVVGWSEDETPTVTQGLQIHAMASDLSHPRSLYTLPNGDVLVIESQGPGSEPIKRPKDLIMGFLQSLASPVAAARRSRPIRSHCCATRMAMAFRKPELCSSIT